MTEYTVILVDTPEEAFEINRKYADSRYTDHKTEAFSAHRQMVGLQHRGKRPTKIIDRIRNRNGERFEKWYQSEVMRNAVKAEIVPEYDKPVFNFEVKTFTMSDLSGKTIEIFSGSDYANGMSTTVTMGRDVKTGVIYVLDSKTEVNE